MADLDLNIHTAPSVSLPPRLARIGNRRPLAAALERLVITRQHGNAASYSYGICRRKPRIVAEPFATSTGNPHMTRPRLGDGGWEEADPTCLPACLLRLPGSESLTELPHHLQLSR